MERRKATDIVRGSNAIDGAGVHLRRVLGLRTVEKFDPFLMLDGFDSSDPAEYTKGFPWHPHRGIETVSYLVEGVMTHEDNLGNKGVLNSLESQWMTAGSGIMHQEMPQAVDHMLGCQLWVNLPKEHKMATPAYGNITRDKVPVIQEENAEVRIIAGEYEGQKGAFKPSYVKVTYLDIKLDPNTEWSYSDRPNSETLFTYLLDGTLAADESLSEYEDKACAILFSPSDRSESTREEVRIKAGDQGTRLILVAAKPLNEPVTWGGPIVMNTKEELEKAFEELDNGTFIKENAVQN